MKSSALNRELETEYTIFIFGTKDYRGYINKCRNKLGLSCAKLRSS
jgi:hypothetical protein